ncbi:MAG: peptidylprolyl isomerase [Acidimicrobiales bacterium]
MTRLPRLLVAAVLAALLAVVSGACAVVQPNALTVGSRSLSDQDFLDTMAKVSASPTLVQQLGVTGADATAAKNGQAYPTTMTAQVLTLYAQSWLFIDLVAQRGIAVTDQQREEGRQALAQLVGGSSSTQAGASAASLDALGPLQPVLVEGYAAQTALGESLLNPDEVAAKGRAAYDANKDQLVQACASVILIAPPGADTATTAPSAADIDAQQARADSVKARLDGGADFAAVAATESAEPQSRAQGGSIGCRSRSQSASLPQEFVDALFVAPVGQVTGPLRSADGWYLIKVTSRDAPPYEQVQAQIESQVRQTDGQKAIGAAFAEAVKGMTVTVDPRYGRWDPAQQAVAPPQGAQPPPTSPLAPGARAGGTDLGGGVSVQTGPDGQPQLVGPDGQPIDASALGGGGAASSGAASSGAASGAGSSAGGAAASSTTTRP